MGAVILCMPVLSSYSSSIVLLIISVIIWLQSVYIPVKVYGILSEHDPLLKVKEPLSEKELAIRKLIS